MKIHSDGFKRQIKLIGKEIDSKITYGNTVLGKNDLNTVTPNYQGGILTSVMKQLDIDSNVEIPVGTILKYEFGVKVNGVYEYINYGNYIVHKVEKQEDTHSYLITCYDKMLYAMVDYKKDGITYPTTIRNYLKAICNKLGLTFANENQEFANYDKVIESDLYDGLDYTYRDVLDDIAQVTASTICINNDDELEIRYINDTGDTIDEEFLKDVNVNFGKKYGPINSIVLSRSAESDNVYLQDEESVAQNGLTELKIINNQIMNFNNRADYLPEILGKLNGLEYYINDFTSTGITYYDLCDRYNVKIGDNIYSCIMFNNEVDVTQGLQELVYTEMPKETETDYKKADKTDRKINQTYIIVDKQNQTINALASSVSEIETEVVPTGQASGSNIHISDSADAELLDFKLYGKSTQETRSGKNIITGFRSSGNTYINYNIDNSKLTNQMTYSFIAPFDATSVVVYIRTVSSAGIFSKGTINIVSNQKTSFTFDLTNEEIQALQNENSFIQLYKAGAQWGTPTLEEPQLENGATTTEYEIYGAMPSPDYPSEIESVGYTNLFCGYDNMLVGFLPATGSYPVTNTSYPNARYQLIELNAGESITTLLLGSDNNKGRIRCIDKKTNEVIGSVGATTTSANDYYTSNVWYSSSFNTGTITAKKDIILGIMLLMDADLQFQITKGTQKYNYIPFGKYGVEVEMIGKNKLNPNSQTQTLQGITVTNNGDGTFTAKGTSTKNMSIRLTKDKIKLDKGKTYTNSIEILSGSLDNATIAVTVKNTNDETTYNYINLYSNVLSNTKTPTEDLTIDAYGFYVGSAGKTIDVTFRVQLEENSQATNWEEYKITPTLIQSPYPLMSNKDETIRDYYYLQNGNLYLKKQMGEVVLNGSESWGSAYELTNTIDFYTTINDTPVNNTALSTHFTKATSWNNLTTGDYEQFELFSNKTLHCRISKAIASTIVEFKTWLSENNVKVQYELAEPQDILIAENVDSLITYKNVTNISTTDNLQPNMEVVYVKDNTLNDIYQTQNGMNKYYTKVENDAQLEITDEKIESSVTEIRSALDTVKETVDRIDTTYLTQTSEQFEMLFKQTGIKEIVDSVDALTKSNNATLVEQEQWIRFKGGNIELGRSDSQVKLLLSNDKILFMTGGNESAYISNNQLYITDSTILNKLQVGHWETKEENGNLNTRWIEGVI